MQAVTGSGKRRRFGLGLLHRIELPVPDTGISVAPDAELADQVAGELRRARPFSAKYQKISDLVWRAALWRTATRFSIACISLSRRRGAC